MVLLFGCLGLSHSGDMRMISKAPQAKLFWNNQMLMDIWLKIVTIFHLIKIHTKWLLSQKLLIRVLDPGCRSFLSQRELGGGRHWPHWRDSTRGWFLTENLSTHLNTKYQSQPISVFCKWYLETWFLDNKPLFSFFVTRDIPLMTRFRKSW